MLSKNIVRIISVSFILLLLSSCGDNSKMDELQRFVTTEKQKALTYKTKKTAFSLQLPQAVTYHPYQGQANLAAKNATNGAVDPLYGSALSSLQFVGTITEDNKIIAYIMTPDDLIHEVKEGDVIGDNYGKISKITPDHVDVVEKTIQVGKQPIEKVVTLHLKE